MNYDILVFSIAVFIAVVFLLDYGADKFIDHTAIVAWRLGFVSMCLKEIP